MNCRLNQKFVTATQRFFTPFVAVFFARSYTVVNYRVEKSDEAFRKCIFSKPVPGPVNVII